MTREDLGFSEGHGSATPLRELGLRIEGSALGAVVEEFRSELERAGIRKVRPAFYLSTEWGVSEGTIAIAIPFYLARPELTDLHAQRVGHVEGMGHADILRYLRHEMGHVINYAYLLFDDEEWTATFGPMSRPYLEEFALEPFSRRFVRHLPGWYAQKHPDEDWAETFAVWMTPGLDWRADYAEWPEALAKLQYCDRTMAALADREPSVTAGDLDEDVGQIADSADELYRRLQGEGMAFPPGLDVALRSIFENHGGGDSGSSASVLIKRLEPELMAAVYCWTGHFPEQLRPIIVQLAERAERQGLSYQVDREEHVIVGLSTFLTTLAMNYVHRGDYLL